jgi:hypothetical protein
MPQDQALHSEMGTEEIKDRGSLTSFGFDRSHFAFTLGKPRRIATRHGSSLRGHSLKWAVLKPFVVLGGLLHGSALHNIQADSDNLHAIQRTIDDVHRGGFRRAEWSTLSPPKRSLGAQH